MAVAVAALALVAGGAVTVATAHDGDDDGAGAAPASASADAGFARDMAVHHQQAVEMSFVVRDRTDDEEIRRLAYDIANTQANQRGMLLGWLDMWGLPKTTEDKPMKWMGMRSLPEGKDGALMPGMATRKELGELREAKGEDAEILYLQLMTDHHLGGLHMSGGCAAKCENPAERRLAKGQVDSQQSEVALMEKLLTARGAKPRGQ
ncbi:DUF305 domain-containing protein [Streptomyces tsukubensis]|nr:DUF305 domain-containing protein [Streptomyces tsukubensis]